MKEIKAKILPLGDKAITVEFGNQISDEINNNVINLSLALEQSGLKAIEEIVPTYRSLLVYYNPLLIDFTTLRNKIFDLINLNLSNQSELEKNKKVHVVPVCYGGEFGPDLNYVAQYNNLTEEDVIRLHCSVEYKIYMIGFAPGFPYLGGMPKSIATPRLETPRKLVRAGSVGIAGEQTGIYPLDDPGGWRIIGRTPLQLYNINKDPPISFKAGEYIKFQPISMEEYKYIESQIKTG